MAAIEKFEDIKAWQKARVLCQEIHLISVSTGLRTDYTLKDQINRSSGSSMDNIAEGFGRGSNTEFIRFLEISHASVCECQSQLYRILDRKYIDEDKFKLLYELASEVKKMVMAFMSYLSKSTHQGLKFKLRET